MAQQSIFLKFGSPDLKGESQVTGHKDEIQLESCSLAGSNAASFVGTQGLSAGAFRAADVVCSAYVGQQSTQILKNCVEGTHFGEITLTCDKAGSGNKLQTFVKWTFKQAIVSSYSVSGTPASAEQFYTETFTIAYTSCKFEYYKQDPAKGNVTLANSCEFNLAKAETASA